MILPSILLGLFLAAFVLCWKNLTGAANAGQIFTWWLLGIVSVYGASMSALFLLYAVYPV